MLHGMTTFGTLGSERHHPEGSGGGGSGPLVNFPGNTGNPVGFAATPATAPASFTSLNGGTWPGAYPGSLTTYPGGGGLIVISDGTHATSGAGTLANPYVFAFYDFNSGTSGIDVAIANCIFVGCRFQSNDVGNYCLQQAANNLATIYCTFSPLVSLCPNYPGFGTTWAWPSNGYGAAQVYYNNSTNNPNPSSYMSPNGDGSEYGLNIANGVGPTLADHCEFWGFGQGVNPLGTSTGGIVVEDCWFHDPAYSTNQGGVDQDYHIDGPGYENAATAPSNFLVKHCTIAYLSNNNQIAFQQATSAYNNITIENCFLSGGNDCFVLAYGNGGSTQNSATNLTVTGNLFSTGFPCYALVIVNNGGTSATTLFTHASNPTNSWSGNTLLVEPSTAPEANNVNGTAPFQFTSANNGNYVWPDGSLNATDWTG